MLIKKVVDHNVIVTPTCGVIREILRAGELDNFDLAVSIDIKPTSAHFHNKTSEVYFVLDGKITLEIFDPIKQERSQHELEANELAVITPGLHHRISAASTQNRLCVISSPRWQADDEHLSKML